MWKTNRPVLKDRLKTLSIDTSLEMVMRCRDDVYAGQRVYACSQFNVSVMSLCSTMSGAFRDTQILLIERKTIEVVCVYINFGWSVHVCLFFCCLFVQ